MSQTDAHLLIVDDDAALRQTLAEQLSLDGEFAPAEALDRLDAAARTATQGMVW